MSTIGTFVLNPIRLLPLRLDSSAGILDKSLFALSEILLNGLFSNEVLECIFSKISSLVIVFTPTTASSEENLTVYP